MNLDITENEAKLLEAALEAHQAVGYKAGYKADLLTKLELVEVIVTVTEWQLPSHCASNRRMALELLRENCSGYPDVPEQYVENLITGLENKKPCVLHMIRKSVRDFEFHGFTVMVS